MGVVVRLSSAGVSCSELPGKYIALFFFLFLLGLLVPSGECEERVHSGNMYFALNRLVRSKFKQSPQIEIHIVVLDCPALKLTGAPLGRDARKELGKWEIESWGRNRKHCGRNHLLQNCEMLCHQNMYCELVSCLCRRRQRIVL